MEPEMELKVFLETPITQKNVIVMMEEAADLIEDPNGPFEINKLEVLMHAVNDGKVIPGDDKGMTALTVIQSGKFWSGEPQDCGGLDRWLKCAIDHDYLEIFTMFGQRTWIAKYIKYGLKYGTVRWLHFFYLKENFGQAFYELIRDEPELTIKLIDSWKMVMIPDILKKDGINATSFYRDMLNNPVYHRYILKNFPEYSSKFSKKEIMVDIIGTNENLEELVLEKIIQTENLQKYQNQIDF